MTFAEVVNHLMVGKRVRKSTWNDSTAYLIYDKECNTFDFYYATDGSIYMTQSYSSLDLTAKDLTTDSWEVVE